MKSYIYQIRNLVNDRVYIGQTVMLSARRRQHFSDLRCKRHGNVILQRAFEKHGEENFVFENLLVVEGEQKDFDDAEMKIIASVSKDKRYNISEGGGAFMKNRKHTLESRAKISASHLGTKKSAETKLRMSQNRKGLTAGEKSGRAKLTEEQAREIKFIHLPTRQLSQKKIGKIYGVSRQAISGIQQGSNWASLVPNKI